MPILWPHSDPTLLLVVLSDVMWPGIFARILSDCPRQQLVLLPIRLDRLGLHQSCPLTAIKFENVDSLPCVCQGISASGLNTRRKGFFSLKLLIISCNSAVRALG